MAKIYKENSMVCQGNIDRKYIRQLVISFEFKKFFVLRGNDVIKTILGNVNVGNVILPPVKEMGENHPVNGLMTDYHNVVRAPV